MFSESGKISLVIFFSPTHNLLLKPLPTWIQGRIGKDAVIWLTHSLEAHSFKTLSFLTPC